GIGLGLGPGMGGRNRMPRRSGQSSAGAVMPTQRASAYLLDTVRWPYSNALGSAWGAFLDLVDRELAQVPAMAVAERLGKTIVVGKAAESSFAALLIAGLSVGKYLKRDTRAVNRRVWILPGDVR